MKSDRSRSTASGKKEKKGREGMGGGLFPLPAWAQARGVGLFTTRWDG